MSPVRFCNMSISFYIDECRIGPNSALPFKERFTRVPSVLK